MLMNMENNDTIDLGTLKYADLRKLAKKHGIKANMKAEKLVSALSKYYNTGDVSSKLSSNESTDDDTDLSSDTTPGTETSRKMTPLSSRITSTTPNSMSANSVCHTRTISHATQQEKQRVTKIDTPNVGGKKTTPNASGRKSTPSVAGRKATPKVPGRKSTPKVPGRKSTPKVPGRKSTPKVTGRKSTPKVPGRKSTPKVPGRKSTPKVSGRKSTPKVTGRTSTPKVPGRQSTPKVHGRKSTPKVPGRQSTPKVPGRKATPKASPKDVTMVNPLIDSMKENMTDAEMKESMLEALDAKVKEKKATQSTAQADTQIPRFMAFLQKRKAAEEKPVTPGNKDWKRIHEKAFSKMDSIGDYLKKKRQRTDSCNPDSTNKKAKLTETKTCSTKAATKLFKAKTPTSTVKPRMSLHKSVPRKVNNVKPVRRPSMSAISNNTPVTKNASKKSFVPTVLSTKHMNLSFGQKPSVTLPSSTIKKGLVITKTFVPSITSTKGMNLNFGGTKSASARKPAFSASKTPVNTSKLRATFEGGSMKKDKNCTLIEQGEKFNLAKSLAKSVTYKPHTGKLAPFKLENMYTQKTTVQVKSRNERAKLEEKRRTERRKNVMQKRRRIST